MGLNRKWALLPSEVGVANQRLLIDADLSEDAKLAIF